MDKIEDLVSHIKDYFNIRIELVKLRFAATASKIISNIASFIIFSFFILLFVIFLGISAALFIGEKTGSMPLGFLIISGAFFLTGFLIWIFREKLIRTPVMNSIIGQLHGEEEANQSGDENHKKI